MFEFESKGELIVRRIGLKQRIKNLIGDIFGYRRCYACGCTLWGENVGQYFISQSVSKPVCGRCKHSWVVVENNLKIRFSKSPDIDKLIDYCPNCKKIVVFRIRKEGRGIHDYYYAKCSDCDREIFLKEETKPEVRKYIEEQKNKLYNLRGELEKLGIPVTGEFFKQWEYSPTYVANFYWGNYKNAPKRYMVVDDVLNYLKSIKDNIAQVVLGSEGHYSVCEHWVFVIRKDGFVEVINVEPYTIEDLYKVVEG